VAALDLKPFHHDESVNFGFVEDLVKKGWYAYNPTNYHGPLLYELAYIPARVFGMDSADLRAMPAFLGVLAVAALLALSPWIGVAGALFAGGAMAVAGAEVYFARTFIHEIYLVALLAIATVFLFRFQARARARDLAACLAAWSLAFAIKETAAISLAAVTVAALCALAFGRPDQSPLPLGNPFSRMEGRRDIKTLDALGVAILIWALTFSTFGINPRGLADFFYAYIPWTRTGVGETGHEKPPIYFFRLSAEYYAPLLIAALPALFAVMRRNAAAIFFLVWWVSHLAIYSAIPYKTPWCVISINLPLFMLAGIGVQTAAERLAKHPRIRAGAVAAAFAVLLPYAASSVELNFLHYDRDGEDIVYVQTRRRYLAMIRRIHAAAARYGGPDTPIQVVDAKHPIRFYLRGFTNQAHFQEMPTTPLDAPIVVVDESLAEAARERIIGRRHEETIPVWPGHNEVIFTLLDPISGDDP
ncbi:TIGR03663 family protein, partial [bacterium]|nr:TIGR03663 family protein [bacterium]